MFFLIAQKKGINVYPETLIGGLILQATRFLEVKKLRSVFSASGAHARMIYFTASEGTSATFTANKLGGLPVMFAGVLTRTL